MIQKLKITIDKTKELNVIQKKSYKTKKIKKIDSEFYVHLKENLTKLLKFNLLNVKPTKIKEKNIMSNINQNNVKNKFCTLKQFTRNDFEHLKKILRKTPLIGLRRCVIAFRNGTLLQFENYSGILVHFSDSEVYSDFMKFMILEMNSILRHILTIKNSENITKKQLKGKRWKKAKKLFCIYFVSLCRFLKITVESDMQGFILRNITLFTPYLADTKHECKILVKLLCIFWIRGKPIVRNSSFFTILHFSVKFQDDILNMILKHMYLHFIQKLKKSNDDNHQKIVNYLISTLVEIFGINQIVSYRHIFYSIQSIAIQLQNALLLDEKHLKGNKRKTFLKNNDLKQNAKVYVLANDWRYIHCLMSFIKIFNKHVTHINSLLFPLVYPLVEILMGTMKLHPNINSAPLRLKCIEFSIELVENCQVHIPIVPQLINIIQWSGLRKKYIDKSVMLDLRFTLQFKDKDLETKKIHEALIKKVCTLLMSYFNSYNSCVSFPELSLPIINLLKQEIKNANWIHKKIKKPILFFCKKIKEHVDWIQSKRESLKLTPKDIKDLQTFKSEVLYSPLVLYFQNSSAFKLDNKTFISKILGKNFYN